MPDARHRLIVALDLPSASEARRAVEELGDACSFYKVGMQLLVAAGPDYVRELIATGKRVFLDLKLHEIPNSVAEGVKAAAALGVDMVSVHASNGSSGLRAAVEAASVSPKPLSVLALTVITSLDNAGLHEIGVESSVEQQVLRLARLARDAGCQGLVASPREVAMLRAELSSAMTIVVAGARPAGSERGDQTRAGTPGAALRDGASYVVIGRPIVGAPDRRAAAEAIVEEMSASGP